MSVNYTYNTVTSDSIIKELLKSGHKLTDQDKQMIITKVYNSITTAMKWASNGCDCGQMSCPICGN